MRSISEAIAPKGYYSLHQMFLALATHSIHHLIDAILAQAGIPLTRLAAKGHHGSLTSGRSNPPARGRFAQLGLLAKLGLWPQWSARIDCDYFYLHAPLRCRSLANIKYDFLTTVI